MEEHCPKKLLDQVRDAIRLKHYSYRTKQAEGQMPYLAKPVPISKPAPLNQPVTATEVVTITYTYDPLYRLTSASYSNGRFTPIPTMRWATGRRWSLPKAA